MPPDRDAAITDADVDQALRAFVDQSEFAQRGGIMTDLDGTAVHEWQGRIVIPKPVEMGLKALLELGRPFVLNSLRFPLSVLRTFGRDWYSLSNAPIPCVALNGSVLGHIVQTRDGALGFEEILAFPLEAGEIDSTLDGVQGLLDLGLKDVLVFYYPRDWRMGEVIWTPVPERVLAVKEKYTSASAVTAVELPKLREQMHAEELGMIFLLIDAPQDKRMAYQHTQRTGFVTHRGVDKLYGARQMATHLGLDLEQFVGAGDTEMDSFLKGVGLAVLVGPLSLSLRGVRGSIRLRDSVAFGEFLFRLADQVRAKVKP